MHYATKNRCEYVGRTPAGKIKRCRKMAGPESPYCGHHRKQARHDDQLFQAEMRAAREHVLRLRWRLVTVGLSAALAVSIVLGMLF